MCGSASRYIPMHAKMSSAISEIPSCRFPLPLKCRAAPRSSSFCLASLVRQSVREFHSLSLSLPLSASFYELCRSFSLSSSPGLFAKTRTELPVTRCRATRHLENFWNRNFRDSVGRSCRWRIEKSRRSRHSMDPVQLSLQRVAPRDKWRYPRFSKGCLAKCPLEITIGDICARGTEVAR